MNFRGASKAQLLQLYNVCQSLYPINFCCVCISRKYSRVVCIHVLNVCLWYVQRCMSVLTSVTPNTSEEKEAVRNLSRNHRGP